MLIDTHCHVHFNAYKDDMDEVVKETLKNDVAMITVGTQRSTSKNGVELAKKYDGLWAAVGLHPSHLFETFVDEDEVKLHSKNETFDIEYYRELSKDPKVVAIGEMGLDYFHVHDGVSLLDQKKKQFETWEAGARLAKEENLPLITHCRDAHDDQVKLIEKVYGPWSEGDPKRGVIHCFTGTKRDAEKYFKLGFMISFTGIITFPPRKADIEAGKETLQDVVKWAPLDKIMVETDAPYLSPVPYRGKRNHPMYVKYVAEKVAELKDISYEEVAQSTTDNAKRLFNKIKQ